MFDMTTIPSYAISALAFVGFGWLSSLFGQQVSGVSMADQFKTLNRPSWAPPGWIFGIVWGVLYTLMGIGFVNLINGVNVPVSILDLRNFLLVWFVLQYAINFAWSIAYLSAKKIATSLPITITLAGFVVAMTAVTAVAYYLSGSIGYLIASICFLPYALWTSFASVLQWKISQMNP